MASELYVETLKGLTSGDNANKVIIPAGQTLDASAGGFTTPTGHVIQVKNLIKTDISTFSAGSWHTVMELSITPSSTSSDILVTSVVAISQAGGDSMVRIERDGTAVGIGTGGSTLNGIAGQPSGSYSNMTAVAACSYLDSPSKTTAVVYKIQCRSPGQTVYINRRGGGADFGGASYITLMEIAG